MSCSKASFQTHVSMLVGLRSDSCLLFGKLDVVVFLGVFFTHTHKQTNKQTRSDASMLAELGSEMCVV